MAFDWSLVVGTVVGAAAGIAGDWTGRRSERRHADEARRWALEEARAERAATWEHERAVRFQDREYDVLLRLVLAMDELPLLRDLDDPATRDEASATLLRFSRQISNTWIHVLVDDLRVRLRIAGHALELAAEDGLEAYRPPEVLYIVRHTLREAIGARMRGGDVVPEPSPDWVRLEAAILEVLRRFRDQIRRPGFEASVGLADEPDDGP